jgi:hypothetical protein
MNFCLDVIFLKKKKSIMKQMLKVSTFFLVFIITANLLNGEDRKISLAVSYQNIIQDNIPIDVLGVNYEIFVTDKISLNYSFDFSLEPHIQLRHTPIMSYLGWKLLYPALQDLQDENEEESSDPSWAISAFVLSLLIPEGVNFHFPWRDDANTGIIVSINPLGYDYFNSIESFSSGILLQSRFGFGEKFFIAPLAGFSYAYKPKEIIFRIGISAGIIL